MELFLTLVLIHYLKGFWDDIDLIRLTIYTGSMDRTGKWLVNSKKFQHFHFWVKIKKIITSMNYWILMNSPFT